jgi:hypothetical protein
MNIQELRTAFERWTPFEEAPPALITALEASLDEPSTELDTLFRDVVYAFNEASDGFWINYAIKYSRQAQNPELALQYLEHIVRHPEIYIDLAGLFGSAATYLGCLAAYPNRALGQLITAADLGNEESDFILQHARASAFGAYIMTATTFDYGLTAGRAIRDRGEQPTLERAEALIRAWSGSPTPA